MTHVEVTVKHTVYSRTCLFFITPFVTLIMTPIQSGEDSTPQGFEKVPVSSVPLFRDWVNNSAYSLLVSVSVVWQCSIRFLKHATHRLDLIGLGRVSAVYCLETKHKKQPQGPLQQTDRRLSHQVKFLQVALVIVFDCSLILLCTRGQLLPKVPHFTQIYQMHFPVLVIW